MALYYPYGERTERVISIARVFMAALSLITIYLDRSQPSRYQTAGYSLIAAYLLFAILAAALVWRMHKPVRGLQVGSHVLDLTMFVVIMYFTEGSTSPFFVYFVFALVVATLRWKTLGAIATAIASLLAFLALGLLTSRWLRDPEFQLSRFVVRAVYLAIVTLLLTQFDRFERAIRGELERLAKWHRSDPVDLHTLLESSLPEATEIIGARRGLLIWDEPEEPSRFVAYTGPEGFRFMRRPPDVFSNLVEPTLTDVGFIGSSKAGIVALERDGEIRSLSVEGIDPDLRDEFAITDYVSVPLLGREYRGRLFFLEHPAALVDSLFTAEIMASELLARMGSVRVMTDLRSAAVKEQRVRTALDLHDGLLQSLTAAGLELATVTRELPPQMEEARTKLRHVEGLISNERHELRVLIDEMRPGGQGLRPFDLCVRLVELQEFITQHWGIRVRITADDKVLANCSSASNGVAREVYFMAHEGLVNAARHAQATSAELLIARSRGSIRLVVTDDGHGFALQGRHSLEELEALGTGPVALARRVRALNGRLVLDSSEQGARVEITLPKVFV
jgi:signal transduction histidine kinase